MKNAIILTLTILGTGCASHINAEGKSVYVQKDNLVAVPFVRPGMDAVATKKEIIASGLKVPSENQIEKFNRLNASCDMKCSDRLQVSKGSMHDGRWDCRLACMRAEGWELQNILEVQ